MCTSYGSHTSPDDDESDDVDDDDDDDDAFGSGFHRPEPPNPLSMSLLPSTSRIAGPCSPT